VTSLSVRGSHSGSTRHIFPPASLICRTMIAILLRRGAPTPIRAPCCRSSPSPGSAPQRQDYGPLVELVEVLFPDATERETLFWKTLQRLFGFVALGLERKRYANLPW
jgi:hypothetical protein